jgi:signal transduction histidine kinase
VSLDEALRVEVRDDGRGYAGPRVGGIGIGSMENRAAQLGGRCEVRGGETGTVVTAELPVAHAALAPARAEAS